MTEGGESVLRSKARALAESVWNEARKTAVMTFDTISDDARNIMIDCCLKGMCVGIVAGSSLIRPEQDEDPLATPPSPSPDMDKDMKSDG